MLHSTPTNAALPSRLMVSMGRSATESRRDARGLTGVPGCPIKYVSVRPATAEGTRQLGTKRDEKMRRRRSCGHYVTSCVRVTNSGLSKVMRCEIVLVAPGDPPIKSKSRRAGAKMMP